MRRFSIALVQAIECLAIMGVGFAIGFVPILAAWVFEQGFAGGFGLVWRASADAWLLGHGVDLAVTLGDAAVVAVGVDAAADPFVVSVGVFGAATVTMLLAVRSGTRLAGSGGVLWGILGGGVATAVVSTLLAVSAQHESVAPVVGDAAWQPAVVMIAGLLIGLLWRQGPAVLGTVGEWFASPEAAQRIAKGAIASAVGVVVAVLGASAALIGILLFVRFTDLIVLFEGLEPTHLGVVLLWLAQLAMLPTAIVWGMAWMVGPGFQLGVGSSISPIETSTGPVPAIPLLGIVSPGSHPGMLAVVVIPVVAAVIVGFLVRQRTMPEDATWWELALVAIGGGVLAGLVCGHLAWSTSGAIGPGRLSEAGPDGLLVGALAALEASVGLAIGLFAQRAASNASGLVLFSQGGDPVVGDVDEGAERDAAGRDDEAESRTTDNNAEARTTDDERDASTSALTEPLEPLRDLHATRADAGRSVD